MIGDVLLSSILTKRIKSVVPESIIDYVVNENTVAVLENNPFIDNVIIYPHRNLSSLKDRLSLIEKLRKNRYDTVIDAYGTLWSMLTTYTSRAQKKIGYRKKLSSLFYTESVQKHKQQKYRCSLAIENRMKLLEPLDISFKYIQPTIYLTSDERLEASLQLRQASIDRSKCIIMVNVLGSSPQKTYPPTYMASLLDYVSSQIADVVFLFNYIPDQKTEAVSIYKKCAEKTQEKIKIDFYAKSLRSFLAVTSHCDCLIGNEGGAINMAKALGVRTYAIYAPPLKLKNWHDENQPDRYRAIHICQTDAAPDEEISNEELRDYKYYLDFRPELFQNDLVNFISK